MELIIYTLIVGKHLYFIVCLNRKKDKDTE